MSSIFIIRDHRGFFLTKQGELADGTEPATLFKTPHKDIALNALIEFNAKDIDLRGEVIEAETTPKGLPIVEVTATLATEEVCSPLPGEGCDDSEDEYDAAPSNTSEAEIAIANEGESADEAEAPIHDAPDELRDESAGL